MKLSKKSLRNTIILILCISMVTIRSSQIKTINDGYELGNEQNIVKSPQLSSIDATVHINASNIIRELPWNTIGTAISYVNNGSGILNPYTLEFYDGILDKYAAMGMGTLRFPGGTLGQHYHWFDGIGPKANRPMSTNYFTGQSTSNNYGIGEHFELCNASGAEPTIIVNFETGNKTEASNWVEYCNGEIPSSGTSEWTTSDYDGNETATDGYFAWLRGQYGYSEPYNITNWEIGNEVYDTWTKTYNATEYGVLFNDWSTAMKAEDPNIKIAAVGYEKATGYWNESGRDTLPWNQVVANISGDYMDAINIHMYAPVGDDGRTVYFTWSYEVLKRVTIPQAGDYEMLITAKGMDLATNNYPAASGFSNLSINVDGNSKVNISITTQNPMIYNVTLNFATSGDYNIGVEMLNAASDRMAMMLGNVILKNDANEILIQYKNETLLYDAVMASGLYYRDEIVELKEILEIETDRNDIEVWVTEFNTFYNTIGFSRNQQFEFKSAVGMADMAVQFVYGGADIVQAHNSLSDFFFGLIHEANTLADASMYDTYSLLAEGWGQYLLNSTTNSPTFDLPEKVGWIDQRNDIPYLDIMPTLTGDNLSVILINKHASESMNVNLDIEGFNSTQMAFIKTINASNINAMDYNPPDDLYEYTAGQFGNAIKLNASNIIRYDSNRNVNPKAGSIEFWLKPDWQGNDGLDHPIMSIGNTFFLSKYRTGGIVVSTLNATYGDLNVIWGDCSTWNAGEWHHVAVTWDDTDNLIIYLDGIATMSTSFLNYGTYFDHEQPMVIGSTRSARVNGTDGAIDELRISNVARSPSEILNSYNGGSGTLLTVDENTTMMLHFDSTLEDVELDQRTYINVENFTYHSSGGNIYLPACSISLLKIERYNPAPQIIINSPKENDMTGITAPSFNVYFNDTNLDSMWYSIDGGITNFTILTNSSIDQDAWNNLPNGTVTIIFYANDTKGKLSLASVKVYIDLIVPKIIINSPSSNQIFYDNDTAPTFNIWINETNNHTFWYTVDGGINNFTFVTNGSINLAAWRALPDRPITLTFYSNDTAANINYTSVVIIKDTLAPILSIISPANMTMVGSVTPKITLNIIDATINHSEYSINGGENVTISNPINGTNIITINQTTWNGIGYGAEVFIIFYVNDSFGRSSTVNITLIKRLDEGGNGGSGGNGDGDDDEDSDLMTFITSPIGYGIMGAAIGGIVLIIVKIKKGGSHSAKDKERQRIDDLLGS